jgi:AAA domain
MALLYYENLELQRPERVLRQVDHGLRDVAGYLSRSIDYLKSHAVLRASWRRLGRAELTDLSAEARAAGVWVELDDPEDAGRDGEGALAAFFDDDVRCVHDRVDRPDGRDGVTRFDLAREHRIDLHDRDPRRQRLCLEREPESSEIILVPDTYTLRKQLDAVRALENAPHPAHRPLLDLFQGHRYVTWRDVVPDPIEDEDWILLRPEQSGAPLRPGTEEQRRFVEIALATPDFAILEGPPGSGKTTTICELILQELRRDRRVLLCASTHVAVDNVIERLMAEDQPARDQVIPVRIGDRKKISDKVRRWQLETLQKTEKDELRKWLRAKPRLTPSQRTLLEALDRPGSDVVTRIILDSANVVCGTTIGILQHPDIKRNLEQEHLGRVPVFDLLVVDEASKTTFQELLVPALLAKKWVMVGDARQLSPYVEEDHLAANLDAAVPSADVRAATLDVFEVERFLKAPADRENRHLGAVVVAPASDIEREAYRIEGARRGVPVVDLDAEPAAGGWSLALAGVVLGSEGTLQRRQGELPLDLATVRGVDELTRLRGRARARADGDDERAWGGEVGWRIARSYEKRLLYAGTGPGAEGDSRFREARDLVPSEEALALVGTRTRENESARDAVWRAVDRVRRVALPSVLESLQNGFERAAQQREGTAISDGLPERALRGRHVLLTHQHRMHPELSLFPREHIYDRGALLDPPDMASRRAWPDPIWPTRALWIEVHGRADGTRNEREASAILRQLGRFRSWARTHRRPDGKPWEIAVLTFYRAQEKLLRHALRNSLEQPGAFDWFTLGPGDAPQALIDLCTVDRFQGHEADLVLLSFARTHGVGFLDSPNRLNVALTRARYQLLLVGRRQNFAQQRRSELLQNLAALPATYDLQD